MQAPAAERLMRAGVASGAFKLSSDADSRPVNKAVLRCALTVVFCGNLFWLTSWFKTYGAEGPVLGTQLAADYPSAAHPSYARPAYAGIEFINKAVPKDARVLFLGEARSFYCERDRVSPTVFDGSVIAELLAGSRDGAEVAGRLRRRGFSHVLVNVNELAVWNLAPAFLPLAARGRLQYSAWRGSGGAFQLGLGGLGAQFREVHGADQAFVRRERRVGPGIGLRDLV